MKTTIKRWGINGEGIAYIKNKAVFIDNAIPGEVVDMTITEDHSTYAKGEATDILEPSPRRRHPLCPKWRSCGGCALMHVDYKGQIRMKDSSLKESLRKYANYTGPILPIIKNSSPLGYRNACKLPFGLDGEQIATGMYKKNSNVFVPLERCLIHSKTLEAVRNQLMPLLNESALPVCFKDSKEGLMNLVLKEFNGKVHVIFITTGMDFDPKLIEQILSIDNVASVWQSVKTSKDPEHELFGKTVEHLGGEERMRLDLDGLTLDLLPKSFFQLNTAQAVNLYRTVADWIPKQSNLLVEAYSGIGGISLFCADRAKEVIGIEWIGDAVDNANENARINHKDNVRFVCGDAAKEMEAITQKQHIDTLIVDPPRSGLDLPMKQAILRDLPETLIYVSCNPATLGKDLGLLQKAYTIEKVQPFDFFSQTPHIETAVLLKKKSKETQNIRRAPKRKNKSRRTNKSGT